MSIGWLGKIYKKGNKYEEEVKNEQSEGAITYYFKGNFSNNILFRGSKIEMLN